MTLPARQARTLARLMRILGDPTRLRVLLLLGQGEMNVGQLAVRLRLCQPTVSHHLGLLRLGDLVGTRRDGKQVYYYLRPPRRGRAQAIFQALLANSQPSPTG